MNLLSKKCVPCEGGMPPMPIEEAQKYMAEVMGWNFIKLKFDDAAGSVRQKIAKEFKFKDFKEVMVFVNKVAELSESEGHHPDIFIHGWNKVRFELSTHAIGGLSENDFIMAVKIDDIKHFILQSVKI